MNPRWEEAPMDEEDTEEYGDTRRWELMDYSGEGEVLRTEFGPVSPAITEMLQELSDAIKKAWPSVFGGEIAEFGSGSTAPVVYIEPDFPEADYEQIDSFDYSEQVVSISGYPFLLRPVMRPEVSIVKNGPKFPGVVLEQVIMVDSGCDEFGPEPEAHHVLDLNPTPDNPGLVVRCAIAKLFAHIAEERTHRDLVPEPNIGPVPF